MASVVEVPDIGDFSDVPVIEILVAVGDTVAAEDPLVTLESDKATMDVPSPGAGTVAEITVAVGDTVSQGSKIMVLDGAAPDAPAEDGAADERPAEEDAPAPESSPPEPDAGPERAGEPAREPSAPTAVPAGPPTSGATVYASPSVRRAARERGVDLATVSGSGRKGRITVEDVEAAASAPKAAPAAGGAASDDLGLAPWPSLDFAKFGETERIELTRIQKLSKAALARNWVRIPHVTHDDEADITELETFRKQLNAEQSDVKVTMVALLIKASVATLREFPRFNSSLDGDELILKRYWNIGFAADTPQGLVVPVIKDADAKGILDLAGELTELSGKARDGKLGPNDISGATFTISSLGGIGGTSFTPIINAPEVAILGVVRSATKPVWDGSAFVPRLMLPLSLSYDHRVIDGAAAARFTAHLARVLSDLKRALL